MKIILILLPDIWSMKKYQGMPSIHNFLLKATNDFDCIIFTTDENDVEVDYPNARVYKFKKITTTSSNKYIQYLFSRLNFLYLNVAYLHKALLLRVDFHILYCSSSLPVLCTRVLRKIYGIKTIHRIYGTFLYKNINSKLDKIKKYEECLSFWFEADRYIITNDGTRGNIVASKFNIPQKKVDFLINGIDIKPIKDINLLAELKEKLGIPESDLVALSVSRLSSWKRVDRVVKAFNQLSHLHISLLVVGDGPQREEWENLKTNKKIHFVGSLPSQDANVVMSASDMFISMYDYSNVGNPLLEALGHGLPIITLSTGGTLDVIKHKDNGLIVEYSKDEDAIITCLRDHIEFLVGNSTERVRLSKSAYDYSKKHILDWDSRIENEIDIIKSL